MQGHLGVHDAITAARLEETFQMDEWGLVEGGHDIDIADMQVRIAGPTVFLRLLQASQRFSGQHAMAYNTCMTRN